MSSRRAPLPLTRYFNAPAALSTRRARGQIAWHPQLAQLLPHLPRGEQSYWGLPFRLGPDDLEKPGVILLASGRPEVRVSVKQTATHLCLLHFCDLADDPGQRSGGGEQLAEYVMEYADGETHTVPIRRRFEINAFTADWGHDAFAAVRSSSPRPTVASDHRPHNWGMMQTGITSDGGPLQTWVYALENPRPEAEISRLVLRGAHASPVAVLGVTVYEGPGHPLRHVPRKVYRLLLPAAEKAMPDQVQARLDMGTVTRLYAAPAAVDEAWLQAPDRGLGEERCSRPSREFLLDATGAEGATLTVQVEGKAPHTLDFGEAYSRGKTTDGKARLELVNPRTTWVHVTVVDKSTGKPTATRAHFRGKRGDYLAPYGHHWEVNDNWFEDYAGDLQLGGQPFAYVPGSFQIELPVGECYVELNKGFEYQPVRRRLEIKPGQRELRLAVDRTVDRRAAGWVTADTHVHFLSPQTAALEGKAEGLNLINLLASQWGRLYTNVGDITGEASGCSDEETLVWVGTENRHHLLGHLSMLGTHGDPVFPMCAGGPGEAYLGDPELRALTEWARECRAKDGVVIRPHFPSPICEEPAYFMLGQLDGAELRQFADGAAGPLEVFQFSEWYRYLNCGCRVAAVGGTDKMSAGMPVGGVRTYAQLDPNEEFSFENWGKAVRAGRTFTTSGPLLDLTVDGQPIGSEIKLKAGGGELEIAASATSQWPINALEVVVNGQVVADTRRLQGARALSLRQTIRVEGSAWIAARCGSSLRVNHCWPIHLGAHTSPVYVIAGGQPLWSPSDATYMLTLLDGGMTYLDTLSVRYSDERHAAIKRVYEEAKREIRRRGRSA
jgi:hypothetical protein